MTDSQAPGTPASSWSPPDLDLVQKRASSLFCPAPTTAISKKKMRPQKLIEPDIPFGEPDDSRNYGGPNVRLRVPGGEEEDKRRCAAQKRTLCCKGPASMPRMVRNCWHCTFPFSKVRIGGKRVNMSGGWGRWYFEWLVWGLSEDILLSKDGCKSPHFPQHHPSLSIVAWNSKREIFNF